MAKQDTNYINRYNRENYDRVVIMVPKGTKDNIKAEAQRRGQSANEFLLSLIPEKLVTKRVYVKRKVERL